MDRQVSTATSGGNRSSIDAAVAALGHKTLMGVRLVVQPGELVAVVGEVGAGKSSLLAALLGELMPVRGPDGQVTGTWHCQTVGAGRCSPLAALKGLFMPVGGSDGKVNGMHRCYLVQMCARRHCFASPWWLQVAQRWWVWPIVLGRERHSTL